MAEGYASDVAGDETVMESPEVTISIDLSQLPPEQALVLAQESGIDNFDAFTVGGMMKGETETHNEPEDAEFHIPLGTGLTVLDELGAIDLPEQPPKNEDTVEVDV